MRRWIWGVLGIASFSLFGLIWWAKGHRDVPVDRHSRGAEANVGSHVAGMAEPSIVLPPSLANDKSFSVEAVNSLAARPKGFAAAGRIYKFGPSGRIFPQPVTITVPYDERVVAKGAVLALWTRSEGSAQWTKVEGVQNDQVRHVLIAQVMHFSMFVVGQDCTDNDADGVSVCEGDCDDTNPSVHPGAPEICWNRMDDNCNGLVDEACPSEW